MFNKIYEKLKRFIKENALFLICILLILFVFHYEFPYVIYKSGGTIPLSNRVIIDKDYKEDGKIQMSYVTAMKGRLPFIILTHILPDWDLIPLKDITDEGSYDDVLEIGKEYMNEGIDNAIISAFNESNYYVNITKEINKVIYIDKQSDNDIKIGDEIISIDKKEYKTLEEIRKYINSLKENDIVKIKVINNEEEYERTAKIYKSDDGTLLIGVVFKTTYEYETEIPVSIKMKNNESGSSGGLMMSLAIYNALTNEDITHGKNIVGTGTIDHNGVVGEIGGIKYKLLGAVKNKADIFMCPKDNYEEAVKIKKDRNLNIKIVKVESLKDAINYLNNIE